MSRSIDNRVVEMEFDNARFEKNVSKSLSTLDKLKAALSFKGVENNFEDVEDATGGLAKSFSALETIAVGALLNIGNKVADWAQRTIKELSGVQNVMEGFSKFSKITQSSATLAAQGFEAAEIERELSRLNWFTDETSYNLTDMVDNISKFTASGQGLKESSDAMQGIALWAALSGQNAQTASRAMYQLSQAMSTYMKREDWRSIQNANMDTIEFRRMALDAAVKLGTLEKLSDGSYRSLVDGLKKEGAEAFTESQFVERLTSGMWFTKDVMMDVYRSYAKGAEEIYEYVESHAGATVRDAVEALGDSLDKFGKKAFEAGQQARTWEDAVNSVKDALSTKWMGIFESIFGKYEEATKFFTDLSYAFYDLFVEPVSRRVAGFERWADEGGAAILRSSIIDSLYLILDLVTNIKDAFDDFFYWNPVKDFLKDAGTAIDTYEKLSETNPMQKFEEDTREFQKRDKAWEQISEYYHMDPNSEDDRENYLIGRKAANLTKVSDAISSFVNKMKEYSDETHVFSRILNGVFAIMDMIKQAASGLFSAIKPLFGDGSGATGMAKKFLEVLAKIGDWLVTADTKLKNLDFFKKFFETLLTPIYNLKKAITEFFDVFGAKLKERFGKWKKANEGLSDSFSKVGDILKGMVETIASWWRKLFTNFDAEKLVNAIFNTVDWIKKAFYDLTGIEPGTLGDRMKAALSKIQNDLTDFKETAPGKIKDAWNAIRGWFETAFSWIEKHWTDIANTIKSVWEGVWSFLSGIWNGVKGIFSGDDGGFSFEDLKETLKTIGDILGALIKTIGQGLKPLLDGMKNSLENLSLGQIGAALAGGGALAAGTGIYKIIKTVRNVANGLDKILGSLSKVLNGFAHVLDAKALKEAATAVAILVGSLFVLILLPQDKLMESVAALSIIIAVISKSMQQMSSMNRISIGKGGFSSKKNSAGMMFMEVAIGLLLVAAAMKMIANIPTDQLYSALFVMGVLILIITKALDSISKFNETKGKGNYYNKNVSLINMSGPAGMLMAFALLMYVFTNSITKLADVALNNMKGLVVSFAAIALLIGGMVVVIKELNKVDIDSSNIAKTILSFAAVIFILAKSIEIMATIDPWAMAEAGLIIFAIIALLGAIIVETKGRTFKNFDQLASGLKTFALVIAVIGGIIYLLGQIPLEDLAKGGVAVAGIALILAAMVALSTWKNFKPANFTKMVDSMIYMSLAIAILGVIVYGLAQLSGAELTRGLIGLAAIAAIIAGLTVLASKTGDGIEKVGKALMYVGIAAAALGVGLLAVVAALKLLSDESVDIDKAFQKISKLIKNFLTELPEWLALISVAIVTFVINLIADIIVEFVNMVDDLIQKFKDNETINKLVTGVIDVACMVIDAVTKSLERIVNSVGAFVLELLTSLGNWLMNNKTKIKEAITTFVTGLLDVFLEFFDGIGKSIFTLITGEGEKEWETWKGNAEIELLGWFATLVIGITACFNPLIAVLEGIIMSIIAIDTMSSQLAAQHKAEEAWRNSDPDAAKKLEDYFVQRADQEWIDKYGYIPTSKKDKGYYAYQQKREAAIQEASNYFVGGYRIVGGRLLELSNESLAYRDAYQTLLDSNTTLTTDQMKFLAQSSTSTATAWMQGYNKGSKSDYSDSYGRGNGATKATVEINQYIETKAVDAAEAYRGTNMATGKLENLMKLVNQGAQ